MVECFDGLARITSKELASTRSVKSGTLQNARSRRQRVVANLGRSALMHFFRLMNNLVKGPKRMLKKNDLHENVWQPVVNFDKNHERSGRPDKNRDTHHDLKRGPTGRRSSNARQLGCVFQDMKPPKSIYGRAQTCRNQSNVYNSQRLLHVTLKFETKILRSDEFAQVNLISAAPTLQNLRIGLRRRKDGKSKLLAKQRGSWPKVY